MVAKHENAGIGVSASWRDKVFTNAHALMLVVVLSASSVGAEAVEVVTPSPGVDSEQSALTARTQATLPVPDARRRTVSSKDAGHWIQLSNPDDVTQCILNFAAALAH